MVIKWFGDIGSYLAVEQAGSNRGRCWELDEIEGTFTGIVCLEK